MSTAFGHSAGWRVGALFRAARNHSGRVARAGLAVVLLALVLAAALSIPGPGGTNLANAAIQRAKSMIELMQQRSPGKRTVAHLAMIKHKKLALHERALPKVRRRPPATAMAVIPPFPTEFPPALVDLVAPPVPVQMASLAALPVGPFQQPGFPGFFLPPPGGGLVLPPTQTPGSPPIVTPPIVTPPAELPAVPEPGTWAMILLGFAMIGWSLRRTPRWEQTAA